MQSFSELYLWSSCKGQLRCQFPEWRRKNYKTRTMKKFFTFCYHGFTQWLRVYLQVALYIFSFIYIYSHTIHVSHQEIIIISWKKLHLKAKVCQRKKYHHKQTVQQGNTKLTTGNIVTDFLLVPKSPFLVGQWRRLKQVLCAACCSWSEEKCLY